jgi:cell division protein FtsQ
MWNNYQLLSYLAYTLFALVALAAIYTINVRYIKMPVFPIKQISIKDISGENFENNNFKHLSYAQVESVVQDAVTGNFITVDLMAVQQAFKKLPWVRTAKVYRDWPDGLEVLIEEHEVMARWGNSALVNTYGEVFRASIDDELPVFTGPMLESSRAVAEQFVDFNNILKPLRQRIAKIDLSSRHAWCIRLQTGTVLELGREEVVRRLSRYVSAYDQSIALMDGQESLIYMDLRYPNGFAVRLPEVMQQVQQLSNTEEDVKSGRCN